jgi:hypothetical protein
MIPLTRQKSIWGLPVGSKRRTANEAKLKAEQEYEVYRVAQDKNYISDFDREVKRITGKKDDER